MKGSKCRCGFATLSDRRLCPRCEKRMKQEEWPDGGKVLSFTRLHVVPEGHQEPQDMALVQVENGPKLVCWTSDNLKENDEVHISGMDGRFVCRSKARRRTGRADSSKAD